MKNKKNLLFSIVFYLRWPLIFSLLLVLMNLVLLALDPKAAAAMMIFTVLFVFLSVLLYLYSRKGIYTSLISFAQGFESAESRILNHMSTPTAVCDEKGNILWANDVFIDTFSAQAHRVSSIQSIFPDITKEILDTLTDDSVIHSSFADSRYLIEMKPSLLAADAFSDDESEIELISEAEKPVIIVSINDETELVRYKTDYRDTRPCQGLIYLDNYDEALASVEEVRQSLLTALVDRRISNYIASLNGIVKKLEKDKYLFFITEKDFQQMLEDRFSILEEVKTINIGNSLSLTLSIGIGKDGVNYEQNYEFAGTAIDLALGRGGDQAVIKANEEVTYFGGKTLAQEKNAKVKARVKAQAFKELLAANDKVIVMGHKNGDADSLGAAIGIWRIATSFGKRAHIVLNSTTKSLEPLYRLFADNSDYPDDMFITGEKALGLMDKHTILTVVDVNRPSYTEEPRLVSAASTIVVFDHHRKGTEAVENATLSYVEASASSACEMTTEIIQYIDDNIRITQLEADALYGGIVIDTQNFSTQTGVRTFEAAAFLKRKGASVQKIRKLFRDGLGDFRAKASAIDKAEIYKEHFALSVLDPTGVDSPTVTGAQSANSLLGIDGIKAAIVLTPYNDQIFVSARSIDEVNVQVMMEKIGGGGHMSIAGAQLKDITVDEALDKVKGLIDDMIEKGDIK